MGLFKNKKDMNQTRLVSTFNQIEEKDSPPGWEKVTSLAVGGLTDIGFSKTSNHLLVISSQGRGVVDCDTGETVAQDGEEFGGWFNDQRLSCAGIGPIEDEEISTCGLHGGGLPSGNTHGESIEVVAPNWPVYDMYYCTDYKSAFIEGHREQCTKIDSDYLRAYGFSWCGNYLISATNSDLTLWKRS